MNFVLIQCWLISIFFMEQSLDVEEADGGARGDTSKWGKQRGEQLYGHVWNAENGTDATEGVQSPHTQNSPAAVGTT